MPPRVFTLAEARALLPELRQLVATAQRARAEVMRYGPDIVDAVVGSGSNGGSHEASAALPAIVRMEDGVQRLTALGVRVTDIKQGLIDFPALRGERLVFLCWHVDEEDIGFWHEINAGFAGRQPIDGEFA